MGTVPQLPSLDRGTCDFLSFPENVTMTPHQGPLWTARSGDGDDTAFRIVVTDDGYCGWVCDAPAAAPRACSPIEVVTALGAEHRNAVLTMTDDACQALRERAFTTADETRASRLRRAAQLLRAARLEASVFAA
jgi:hypothetical protein